MVPASWLEIRSFKGPSLAGRPHCLSERTNRNGVIDVELEIGKRFKEYEASFWQVLPPRMPIIMRLDGRAFHTVTRRLHVAKPFDASFFEKMRLAAMSVCREFDPVFGYMQSDEFSMLLLNDRDHGTQPIFGNDLPKLVSISASVMSVEMSVGLGERVHFDSRASIVPVSDVINYFVWRQIDCQRNARNLWSECTLGTKIGKGSAKKMLSGMGGASQVEMVERETGERFSDMPGPFRLGTALYRDPGERHWMSDPNVPWFAIDRQYVQDRIDAYYAG